MQRWKWFCISILLVVIFVNKFDSVQGSPNSLIPIIESPVSEIHSLVGLAFNLSFVIIDDDPRNYSLQQGVQGQLISTGYIESRFLEFEINYVPLGNYSYTLYVMDYSGNTANKTILVYIELESETTSESYPTEPVKATSFEFHFILLGYLCFIYIMRKRR
ncbi:hypothetical protein [Candidatus Hodarchaeum mangrovi]